MELTFFMNVAGSILCQFFLEKFTYFKTTKWVPQAKFKILVTFPNQGLLCLIFNPIILLDFSIILFI